jgi:glyoxylase-like metal-dependent hydrolase (beta-lactamase superfamily II)
MMAVLLALLVSGAQQPARDVTRPVGTHSGAIGGRVLGADGKTPLRRAIVRLSSSALPRRLTVRADLQGRYTFPGLPAGRYIVAASKAGYLALEYGQRRPFEAGRRIELGGAERLTGVDIVLPPSASISGVVIDDAGERVNQMWVMAARQAYRNGRRTQVISAYTVSNDIGEFRLSGLAPGDYYIVTREREVRVRELSDEPFGYGTTLYPGVSTLASAQPVHVTLGQQVTGVSLPVAAARTAAIAGGVVDETGRPMAALRFGLTDGPDIAGLGGVLGGGTTDASGNFRVAGVRPGTYSISASDQQKSGDIQVDVRELDVSGLTLVIGSGGTLNGRVVTPAGPPGARAGLIQLCALATGVSRCAGGTPRVGPDGSFTWPGVRGARFVRAYGMPAGWWLKAVLQGDRDITDVPLTIGHGDVVGGLEVVFDDKPTTMSGSVADPSGNPVSDYTVVVFSADEARWTPESRFIAAERPDQTGQVRITGLPPGDYLVAAVEWVEEGQWLDPQFLQRLRPLASKLALEAGQTAAAQLKLVQVPER